METLFRPLARAGSISLALLSVFLAFAIKNQLQNPPPVTNTLVVSGEGKAFATPDIAVISATILTQSKDSKAAQDLNSQRSVKVSEFLKAQGIADVDVKTTGYNIYPQYSYPSGGEQYISGYQVSQAYDIKVRDIGKVNTILTGLVSAGANQVNNLGLQVEDPDKAQSEARQKAIDNAKKKAEEIQKQSGIKLGRLVNLSENMSYPGAYYDRAMSGGLGGGGPVIQPGQNETSVTVNLTYQIR